MFESLSPPKDPLLLSVWGFVSPPLGGIRPVLHHAHPVRTMAPNSPAEKGKEEEQDGEKEQQRVQARKRTRIPYGLGTSLDHGNTSNWIQSKLSCAAKNTEETLMN